MKREISNRGRRLLKSPGLHFLLLGSVLFFAEGWLADAGVETAAPERLLEVSPARVDQLHRQWQAAHRRPLTGAERAGLLRQWVEDEILYREALAVGLDRADLGVCRRLVLNMQFLELDGVAEPVTRPASLTEARTAEAELCARARELGLDRDDPVIRRQMAAMMRILMRRGAPGEVSRRDLEDYVARHPERFRAPDRIRWNHVFLNGDRRGEALETDARRLLDRLVADRVDPERAAALGDRLPVGTPHELAAELNLARRLGPAFARRVMELPPGRWSEPLRSAFGLHLIWVHERLDGGFRPWPEIESEARAGLESEREEQRYAAALAQLLDLWQVSVPKGGEA